MHTTEQKAGRGRFITFEGVDGAGKSTQIEAVARALHGRHVDVLRTREPGGTPLGEALRTLMLERSMAPLTETLLLFAAREEHLEQVIRPALAQGRWILCDRFTDASYAYQGGGRGVPAERLDTLAGWVQGTLQPDLTVLVDVDPAEAQRRRARVRAADRFETESAAFFERVRRAYRERAERDRARFLVVDGSATVETVSGAILERVLPWLA
jgi:dTMP kinase